MIDFFKNLHPVLLMELIVIICFIIAQLSAFLKNRSNISKLKNLLPEGHQLFVDFLPIHSNKAISEDDEDTPLEANRVSVIRNDDGLTEGFTKIVETSNNHILKNRGNVELSDLEDIATNKIDTLENSIESVLPMPLYIGLLGTFTGVILGLSKIVISMEISNDTIQLFISGVLIGMIASAFGLLLTILNNSALKNAKAIRDVNLFDYFSFVRLNLLPPSYKAMPTDMKSLKHNLSTFNEEFINHQQSLNNNLENTISRFQELQEVFNNIRGLESGLKNTAQYIKNNTSLMERQASALYDVNKRTESITTQLATAPTTETAVATESTSYVASPTLSKEIVDKLDESEDIQREISAHINGMYAFLQKALSEEQTTQKSFLNSFAFKLFTFTGTLAFIVGLVLGVAYLLKNAAVLF